MKTDEDDKPPVHSTTVDYCRTISQDLRYLDDGLTHAIDQLTTFNSETMSDLSLKYEYIRNNESRVIGFFARQLLLLQKQKSNHQNGGFHSEYIKLDRFLSVLNLNKKSIDFLVKRMTFDDLLNGKAIAREKLLYDAETSEIERKDFRNALNALKDCLDYFSHGGTNDNGRFFWHTETPPPANVTPYSVRQHRLSDTALSVPFSTESTRPTSVTSSLSTEFPTGNNTNSNHPSVGMMSLPQGRRSNFSHTPPPSRSNHLCVNGKRKCEHPSKKSSIDPSIFSNANPSRNNDSQLYDGETTPRRGSCSSDCDNRLPSGAATPKSPTLRSPTFSCSPLNSAHNSDTENDPKTPESLLYNTHSPILTHRMAHKIQHKWSNLMKLSTCNVCAKKIFFLGTKCNGCKFDRARVFKFSFCDVCRRQVFRGKACIHCKYKCHKECVQNAPANCGLSERNLRNMINNVEIQHALAYSSPTTRKTPFTPSESTSPTSLTPMSAPDSPSPHPSLSGYHFNPSTVNSNSSVNVSESIYCTQSDADSWVVIETNSKTISENPESPSDSDAKSTNTSETIANSHRLMRQLSESEPVHPDRENFQATLSISFDDELDQARTHLTNSIQDWVISYDTIKLIEEVKRSAGTLMKAHWHGEMAVRKIKADSKINDAEFLNELKKQVFRLRKVRHEHLNLYTGVCIESPNYAIASNWIRGLTLYEMIHIRNDSISLNQAVQHAAQIARAMSYLHEKSINHMSLRTTNIFIQNNRIILTDYGLVPLTKCYHYNDQPALIAPRGWLSYLAPEIIRKLDPRDEQSILQHTPQTDVYAFGTVWYELLFREFPFAKQPPEYIIWRAGNSLKQPLSSVHISKNAKDIIHQCWSFVPDDRPDFAMLCKSLTKMPSKRTLVRSPSTPLQYHGNPLANHHFN